MIRDTEALRRGCVSGNNTGATSFPGHRVCGGEAAEADGSAAHESHFSAP